MQENERGLWRHGPPVCCVTTLHYLLLAAPTNHCMPACLHNCLPTPLPTAAAWGCPPRTKLPNCLSITSPGASKIHQAASVNLTLLHAAGCFPHSWSMPLTKAGVQAANSATAAAAAAAPESMLERALEEGLSRARGVPVPGAAKPKRAGQDAGAAVRSGGGGGGGGLKRSRAEMRQQEAEEENEAEGEGAEEGQHGEVEEEGLDFLPQRTRQLPSVMVALATELPAGTRVVGARLHKQEKRGWTVEVGGATLNASGGVPAGVCQTSQPEQHVPVRWAAGYEQLHCKWLMPDGVTTRCLPAGPQVCCGPQRAGFRRLSRRMAAVAADLVMTWRHGMGGIYVRRDRLSGSGSEVGPWGWLGLHRNGELLQQQRRHAAAAVSRPRWYAADCSVWA